MEDKKGGSQYQELKSKQTSLISQLININRDERETPTGGTNALQTNNTNGISQIDNKNQLEGQTESEQDWKKVKSKRKPFKKIRGQGEDSEGKFKDNVSKESWKIINEMRTSGSRDEIGKIVIDSQIITNRTVICDEFLKAFMNIQSTNPNFDKVENGALQKMCQYQPNYEKSLKTIHVG
ncbi:hypothetical protein JTB14_004626 [Gonioctena quinquepunctata]|nr:hypothetical protein JTB14_004626 [Gonioctena quinquepunctata]